MQLQERHTDRPGFRPLYQQVRDLLVSRISTGAWRPAEALPSEQALAGEFGVSQGTVRKAIDSLVAENLIERRQGKGTFVAQHTRESAQFRFFKLCHDAGERALPTCKQSTIIRRPASADECEKLGLRKRSDVYQVTRTRYAKNKPVLRENIVVSASLFPNLDTQQPLPNTLYTLYQSEFNISVNGAREQLKAVAADKEAARELQVDVGAPLLSIERIALDVAGRPIELRRTVFLTENTHYSIDLS